MNWADERYVRLYTRDTADLMAAGWEGRLVLYELLRKADRAGVIDYDGDNALLAEMLRIPLEVCEVGVERLARRGCIELTPGALLLVNFMEAQEARQSDALRQRESRAKRRDAARLSQNVTPASQNVTECHTESHGVTGGHTVSQPVTPSLAVPSRAVPKRCAPAHGAPNEMVARFATGAGAAFVLGELEKGMAIRLNKLMALCRERGVNGDDVEAAGRVLAKQSWRDEPMTPSQLAKGNTLFDLVALAKAPARAKAQQEELPVFGATDAGGAE